MSLRTTAQFPTAKQFANLGGLFNQLKVVLDSILAVNHSSGFVTVVLPANTTLSSSIKAQMQGTIDSFQDSVPVKSAEVQGELIVKGSFIAEQQASLSGPPARIKQVELELPPSLGNHAATKSYVDLQAILPGTGLSKSSTTLRVNEDLPHVRSVGTLVSLTSSGLVSTNGLISSGPMTINSTVDMIGDVKMSNVIIGGNVSVTGTSAFSGPMTLTAAVTNPSHVVTKMYVDNSLAQAGNGLTKQGTIFSVLPSLPHVTTLGTLNSLNVSGVAIVSNASSSTDTTSGAVVIAGGMGLGGALNVGSTLNISGTTSLAKQVTLQETAQSTSTSSGALVVQGGAGIGGNVFLGGTLRCAGAVTLTSTTVSTSVGSGSLILSGGAGIAGSTFMSTLTVTTACVVPTPTTSTNPATKGYVDDLVSIAGQGLTKSANTFVVNAALSHVTSLGVLSSLSVAGSASLTNVAISGAMTIPTPTSDSHAATKGYVDGSISTAGQGLSKVGTALSVNATLSHVTTVGTLTTLGVSGLSNLTGALAVTNTAASTSSATGAVTVSGGLGVAGTSSLTNVTISGAVTIPTPTSDSHAATKGYVDGSISTAGQGLSKVGTALSVNATLSHVTTVGTLTTLGVSGSSTLSGQLSITNTTASISSGTGALTVSGGAGFSGAVNLASTLGVTGQSNLGVVRTTGTVTVANTTTSTSASTGALTVSGGAGVTGAVNVGSTLGVTGQSSLGVVQMTGVVTVANTTASTSASTGALSVSGGLGVQGSANVGGTVNVTGAVGVGTAAPVTKLHVIGDTRVQGNLQLTTAANANRIVIAPPATVNTDYVMTLPPGPPSANASYLGVNTDGSTFFDKTLQTQFYDGPLLRTGLKIWVDAVLTNGGTATVTPVTSTGTPIFTNILSVAALAVLNTTSARNVPVCSMKTVASDNSSLTFNVVTGTSNSLSSSAAFAANGITVSVTLIGL